MYKILFVCTGNICRSPTAEGVFRQLVDAAGLAANIATDSVGTGSWHIGDSPDPRAVAAAKARGYDLTPLRGRQLQQGDFESFDLLLAMDQGHYDHLADRCPSGAIERIRMFLELTPDTGRTNVPDPYYGGMEDYELALDLIERGARAWLDRLRAGLA